MCTTRRTARSTRRSAWSTSAACDPDYPQGGTGGFFGTWLRLSRFTVADGQTVPDKASERVLLNIRLFNSSHRGGGMVFADDGRFWLTIGDQFRYETAQDIVNTLEGGVLRLALEVTEGAGGTFTCPAGSHLPVRAFGHPDPQNPAQMIGQPDETSGQLYCIPNDNPWLSPAGANFEEYATIGHRNPHRLAIDAGDRAALGRRGRRVDARGGQHPRDRPQLRLAVPRGQGRRPGAAAAGPDPRHPDRARDRLRARGRGRADRRLRLPRHALPRARGPLPRWRLRLTRKIWAITLDESTMTPPPTCSRRSTRERSATFGQDKSGEIFMGSVAGPGPLYTLQRITAPVPDPPALLSQLGAFSSLATLTPSNVWVPYGLNEPFWSDGARKSRWVAMPNDGGARHAGRARGVRGVRPTGASRTAPC